MSSSVVLRIFKGLQLIETKQFVRDQILIGSELDLIHLQLQDENVSPIHCLIERRGTSFYVSDLGSATGTFRNGEKVVDCRLNPSDHLFVGPFQIEIHFFSLGKNISNSMKMADGSAVVAPVLPTLKGPRNPPLPQLPINLDFKRTLRPGKGSDIEVLVVWRDRVLATHYFTQGQQVVLSNVPDDGVFIPHDFLVEKRPFLDIQGGCRVALPYEAHSVLIGKEESKLEGVYALKQGELLCISFAEDTLQVFVSYCREVIPPKMKESFDFALGEIFGLISALALVLVTALYMTIYAPIRPMVAPSVDETIQYRVRPFQLIPPTVATTSLPPISVAPIQAPKQTKQVRKMSNGGGGLLPMLNDGQISKANQGASDLIIAANKAGAHTGISKPGLEIKAVGISGTGLSTDKIGGPITLGRGSGHQDYGDPGKSSKVGVSIAGTGTEPEFVGSIDKDAVRRVVRSQLPAIKRCYEQGLNLQSDLAGKIVVKFLIGENGVVTASSVKYSSMDNSTVESCVAAKIFQARFPSPPPGSVAEISYPFVFGSQQ